MNFPFIADTIVEQQKLVSTYPQFQQRQADYTPLLIAGAVGLALILLLRR